MRDYTKTDRILLLIQTICMVPRLTLSESSVKEILGNPSKAQYHKIIKELTESSGERLAILEKNKDENGNTQFSINKCEWVIRLINY